MSKNLLMKMISNPKIGYKEVRYWVRTRPETINESDRGKATPLHRAVERGNIAIANILLVWGADPNAKDDLGFTPLHYAVALKNIEMTELLLKNNAIVDARSNNLRTPLHILSLIDASENSVEIANLLLDYMAYNRKEDALGLTPIDYAHRAGNIDLYQILQNG